MKKQIIKSFGMDLDSDEKYIKEGVRFLKNMEFEFGGNADPDFQNIYLGGNENVHHPLRSNTLICGDYTPALGTNKTIGFKEHDGFGYYFIYNSLGGHRIVRIDGLNGGCDYVESKCFYFKDCTTIDSYNINFRKSCKAFFSGECKKYIGEETIIFTTREGEIFEFDFNSAVLTDGFSPTFSEYFNTQCRLDDRCLSFYKIAPPPITCPRYETIPLEESDRNKPNYFLNKNIQIAYRYIYRDGKASILSRISDVITDVLINCNDDISLMSRCINLYLETGNWEVERIEIYKRDCDSGVWFYYDTVDIYDNCSGVENFWERPLNGEYEFTNENGCRELIYKFCNDKSCIVAPDSINQTGVQMPYDVQSLTITQNKDIALNYKNGISMDCENVKGIVPSIVYGEDEKCKIEFVKVKGAIVMHNFVLKMNQPIWSYEGGDVVAGGLTPLNELLDPASVYTSSLDTALDIESVLHDNGFYVYVAGTRYEAHTYQLHMNADHTVKYYGQSVMNGQNLSDIKDQIEDIKDRGEYFIQCFEIELPKNGKYAIRVAGHNADYSDSVDQNTSTYISGLIPQASYDSFDTISAPPNNDKEYIVDTCVSGDEIDLTKSQGYLMWHDLSNTFDLDGNRIRQINKHGYLTYDSSPLDNIILTFDNIQLFTNSVYTDHNGFYFIGHDRQNFSIPQYFFQTKGTDCVDVNIAEGSLETGVIDGYAYSINTDLVANIEPKKVIVKGKITSCGDGVAVGYPIVLSNGAVGYTNEFGEYSIITYFNNSKPLRTENVLIGTSHKSCFITDCNDECICMPLLPVSIPDCSDGDVIATVTDTPPIKTRNKLRTRHNGTIDVGMKRFNYGRETFITNIGSLDIKSVNEIGYVGTTNLEILIPTNLSLPSNTDAISFYITENVKYELQIGWVADSIEFLNTLGNTTSQSSANQMKVCFESLGEYLGDLAETESSNTVGYSFVTGDYLVVTADSNGDLYNGSVAENGFEIISYDSSTNCAIVKYDGRLESLDKENPIFYFEIRRPAPCQDVKFYYELCPSIPLKLLRNDNNGLVLDSEGEPIYVLDLPLDSSGNFYVFNTDIYDTYYYNRDIVLSDHLYPHHSPTDTNNLKCTNKGRPNIENNLYKVCQKTTNGIVSDNYYINGTYNGTGNFPEDNEFEYDIQDTGDIVASSVINNALCVICERNVFTVTINDDYATVDQETGYLKTNSTYLSTTPKQPLKNRGCQYEDVSSIYFTENAGVQFFDIRHSEFCLWNYSGEVLNLNQNIDSYFIEKSKIVLQDRDNWNIITCYDYKKQQRLITFRKEGSPYINNLCEISLNDSETFIFSDRVFASKNMAWKMVSFVPEYYGSSIHNYLGKELYSFANGIGWSHHNHNVKTFNTFYGVVCQKWIEVVCNADNRNVKIFLNIDLEVNEHGFYAKRVVTNQISYRDTNNNQIRQLSEIPMDCFEEREGRYYSAFLMDKNSHDMAGSPNALYEGDYMRGEWCKVLLSGEDGKENEYFELDAVMIEYIYSQLSGNVAK